MEGEYMYKAGTVAELAQFRDKIPDGVHQRALRIVSMLDDLYGAGRDVENGDGGFVLIAENIQDIALINQRYMELDGNTQEAVDVFKCESGLYIDSFFLSNNEFGINILMPMEIAPHALLRDLSEKIR
jgi:hypothetical protein